jgi:hypothetical protein
LIGAIFSGDLQSLIQIAIDKAGLAQPGFLPENFFTIRWVFTRSTSAEDAKSLPEIYLAKNALEAISRHLDALF